MQTRLRGALVQVTASSIIGYILLRDHIRYCVSEGVNAGEGEAYLDELMAPIQRFGAR
jgi:DNA-binding FrmR family transcriptional regulator